VKIEDLRGAPGGRKSSKRVGRGAGSGLGKTSGKGHKGQMSRSGNGRRPGFEGGQMPLQRRLPKRGFTNVFARRYEAVNLRDIERLGLDTVTPEVLVERGVVKNPAVPVKVLGGGEIKRAVTVRANAFSASAEEKIKGAGGTAEVI